MQTSSMYFEMNETSPMRETEIYSVHNNLTRNASSGNPDLDYVPAVSSSDVCICRLLRGELDAT